MIDLIDVKGMGIEVLTKEDLQVFRVQMLNDIRELLIAQNPMPAKRSVVRCIVTVRMLGHRWMKDFDYKGPTRAFLNAIRSLSYSAQVWAELNIMWVIRV
jgi:hypothetical protein